MNSGDDPKISARLLRELAAEFADVEIAPASELLHELIRTEADAERCAQLAMQLAMQPPVDIAAAILSQHRVMLDRFTNELHEALVRLAQPEASGAHRNLVTAQIMDIWPTSTRIHFFRSMRLPAAFAATFVAAPTAATQLRSDVMAAINATDDFSLGAHEWARAEAAVNILVASQLPTALAFVVGEIGRARQLPATFARRSHVLDPAHVALASHASLAPACLPTLGLYLQHAAASRAYTQILRAYCRSAPAQAGDLVRALLRHPVYCAVAIEVVDTCPNQDFADELAGLQQDPRAFIRRTAYRLRQAGDIGPTSVSCGQLLVHPDQRVRHDAIEEFAWDPKVEHLLAFAFALEVNWQVSKRLALVASAPATLDRWTSLLPASTQPWTPSRILTLLTDGTHALAAKQVLSPQLAAACQRGVSKTVDDIVATATYTHAEFDRDTLLTAEQAWHQLLLK